MALEKKNNNNEQILKQEGGRLGARSISSLNPLSNVIVHRFQHYPNDYTGIDYGHYVQVKTIANY